MRSFDVIGAAWVSMRSPLFAVAGCVARVYARGCAPMNIRRLSFWCFGMLAPLAGIAAEQGDAAVRELARDWLTSHDGVGLSIGVYSNGQRHFYNYGATRLDGNKSPTKDTVYEIGS